MIGDKSTFDEQVEWREIKRSMALKVGLYLAMLALLLTAISGVIAQNNWQTVIIRAAVLAVLCGCVGSAVVSLVFKLLQPVAKVSDGLHDNSPNNDSLEIAEVNKQAGNNAGDLI